MVEPRSAILQGTLDLMVLKTLEQMGPLHGYGIARRIEQVGQQSLVVNQGTISAALMIGVGLFAVAGPARRAIRADPTEALRVS